MNAVFSLQMENVDINLINILLSSYNNKKDDLSKRYMTLHNFNIFIASNKFINPEFSFFNDLSKFKDKIYFEFRMDINVPQNHVIRLIYDEPINRMGLKIKKEIMSILLAHKFNGSQDLYTSKISTKSYFYL